MADYLTEELAGTATAAVQVDPRIQQSIAITSPGQGSLLQEEVLRRAQELNDRRLARETEAQLASPTPDFDAITSMAQQYGEAPDPNQTLAAAMSELAGAEPDDRRRLMFDRLGELRGERVANRAANKQAIGERIAQIEAERLEYVRDPNEAVQQAKSDIAAARSVVEFIDGMLLPGYYIEAVNILKDVDPRIASELSDYILPADAIASLPRFLNTMEPEKAKLARERLLRSARNRAGRFMSENRLAEKTLLEEMLASFDDDEAGDKAIISNIFAPLDLVFGVGDVVAGVKGVARLGRGAWDSFKSVSSFATGTPVYDLTPFTEGAKVVAQNALALDPIEGQFSRVDPDLFLANAGTNRAQAVGTLYLPKPPSSPPPPSVSAGAVPPSPRPYTPPSGLPFFDEFYLSPAERANKAQQVEQGLRATFSLRLNDLVMEQGEGGAQAIVRIGDTAGTGFTDSVAAQTWGQQNLNVPFSVVKDQTGTFQVEFKHLFPYQTDDIGEFVDPIRGYGIGKGSRFADWLARSSTQAELNTVKAQALNQEIAEAFTKLTGDDSLRVQDVLLQGESQFKEFSRSDLVNMGLTSKEIEGYEATRRLTAKVWSVKNEAVHQALRAEGYTGELAVDGGTALVKEIDPASLVGAERLLNSSTRTVDLASGNKVSLANLDLSKYRLYRFFEDTKSGYSYGVSARTSAIPAITPLSSQVLKKIDGWMPRYYNAPYFVREVAPDGVTSAVMTARSPSAGDAAVARLKAQNPGKEYRVFRASEVSGEAQGLQDIAMLREQGLLVTSHRKPFALMDAEGGVAAINVNDSIQRMVSSAALQEGVGRWTTAMKIRFDNTYGKALGFTMDLARTPIAPRDKTLEPLFNEAMALYNHVRLVNGLDSAGPAGQYVRGLRNSVSDFFYDFGKVKGLGTVGKWIGDEISGLNPRAVRAMKSATFAAYIGLNPVVHGILQTSMIPTYAGVRHALPYMANGRFMVDSLILQFSKDPLKIRQIAAAMGLRGRYVDDLLKDYNNSGLQQMVDNHLSVLGTFGDQRVATASRTRRAMAAVFNASKAIGFDMGVSIDKRAAWLVMRNRAIKDGRTLTADELKMVAQDAEALTGNLNRADPLFPTQGLLSLALQFQSHSLKMANRIVGGVTGGRIGGEVGISGSEQRNILLAALISWGVAGYGVNELVERLDTKNGWNLPDDVKLALNEGINGYLLNSAIRLADEDGEASKVMVASRFSPFTQSGVLLTNATEIAKLAMTMNWDQLEGFLPAAASLGFTGRMLDASNFALSLAGVTELPPADRALIATGEFFRKFPLVSNSLQAHMAYNLGYKFDSRGQKVVEATKGEAIASLLGMQSYNQYAISQANTSIYGEYDPLSGEALSKELQAAANDTLAWMLPVLRRLGDGEIEWGYAAELVNSHNIAMRTGLDPGEWAYYRDLVARGVMRSDFIKSDKLSDTISSSILSGTTSLESMRDRLYGLDFPNKDQIVPVIEQMFNERNVEPE